MNPPVTTQSLSRIAVGCTLMATFWGVLALYALHSMFPFNAVVLPFEGELLMHSLTPEGWAFFTRNPREAQVSAYIRTDGAWRLVDRGPNGSAENMLGLDR